MSEDRKAEQQEEVVEEQSVAETGSSTEQADRETDGDQAPLEAEPQDAVEDQGEEGEEQTADQTTQPGVKPGETVDEVDEPSVELGETSEVEVTEDGEPASSEVEEPSEPEDPLEKARAETIRVREMLLRTAADFENYRKRIRREIDDTSRRAREELLRELLPVFDNLERAVVHADQAADAESVASGIKMVLKQFEDTMHKLGVQRLIAQGQVFDPTVHEAIQQIESEDAEPGTVVAEVLGGYTWGDRLLRAAMVVVAKAPAPPPKSEEPSA